MADHQARVLVVEDRDDTRETYGRILRLEGFEVCTAESGKAALAVLDAERRFDLILSDLRMAEGSGLELLAEVKSYGRLVPVVIMTAYGTHAISQACKLLGAADYIDQLPDIDTLVSIVRRNIQPQNEAVHANHGRVQLGHAARRWASIVWPIAQSVDDLPTLSAWAHEVGSAPATIKLWCAGAGVPTKSSLDLGRALRLITQFGSRPSFKWRNALSIVSASGVERFLRRAGFHESRPLPSVGDFLATQRLVIDPECLQALRMAMSAPT